MNEVEFIFRQDIREKRNIVRSASHRASRKKGYKGSVKTTYDFMSQKQRKELNGKVRCFTVNDLVMSLEDFKLLNRDQQREILTKYLEKMSRAELATAWGCAKVNINGWRKRLDLVMPRGAKAEEPVVLSPSEALGEAKRAFSLHLEKPMKGSDIKEALMNYAGILQDDKHYDFFLNILGD